MSFTTIEMTPAQLDAKLPDGTTHLSLSPEGVTMFRETSELRKVEAHYERFAEVFDRMSTTKGEVVGAFKAKQAKDPSLTAARFLRFDEATSKRAVSLKTGGLVKLQDGSGNANDPAQMAAELADLGVPDTAISRLTSQPDLMMSLLRWAKSLVEAGDTTTSNDDMPAAPAAPAVQSYREVQAVVHHYRENAEVFERMATTEAEIIGAFKRRQAKDPTLTASRFLRRR